MAPFRRWVGPRQLLQRGLPLGLHAASLTLVALANTALRRLASLPPLETSSLAHALLQELLSRDSLALAQTTLQQLQSDETPDLAASLEFLLHSSLNHGSRDHLQKTMKLLATSPLFPAVLVNCLRKQERTTWPRALHNPLDILFLFRRFLSRGNPDFAAGIVSVLQGVSCTGSEVCLPFPAGTASRDYLYTWCDPAGVSRVALPELAFLLEPFGYLFAEIGPIPASECLAHKAGLELLFVRILQGRFAGLSDVYRFVVMEENRHAELGETVVGRWRLEALLTGVAEEMLTRGLLGAAMRLQRAISWQWLRESSLERPVGDFAAAARAMAGEWQLPPATMFEDSGRFQEEFEKCGDGGDVRRRRERDGVSGGAVSEEGTSER